MWKRAVPIHSSESKNFLSSFQWSFSVCSEAFIDACSRLLHHIDVVDWNEKAVSSKTYSTVRCTSWGDIYIYIIHAPKSLHRLLFRKWSLRLFLNLLRVPLASISPRWHWGRSKRLSVRLHMETTGVLLVRFHGASKRLTWISEGAKFSKSSRSTISKSPDHPLPARSTNPTKILGCIFLTNWCTLFSPEMGLQLTLAPKRCQRSIEFYNIFAHTLSCHRPSCRTRCASSNNIPSHCPTIDRVSHIEPSLLLFLLLVVEQLFLLSRWFVND